MIGFVASRRRIEPRMMQGVLLSRMQIAEHRIEIVGMSSKGEPIRTSTIDTTERGLTSLGGVSTSNGYSHCRHQ
jgi:hypothetical protein